MAKLSTQPTHKLEIFILPNNWKHVDDKRRWLRIVPVAKTNLKRFRDISNNYLYRDTRLVLWGFQNLFSNCNEWYIFPTTHKKLFDVFLVECNKYFNYTTRDGDRISFLNFRIVQNSIGISIDQLNHIQQKILNLHFNVDQFGYLNTWSRVVFDELAWLTLTYNTVNDDTQPCN